MPMPMTPQVPTVEPLARLIHVDDAAGEIERVGALVDHIASGPVGQHFPHGAQCVVEPHRGRVGRQPPAHRLGVAGLARFAARRATPSRR